MLKYLKRKSLINRVVFCVYIVPQDVLFLEYAFFLNF